MLRTEHMYEVTVEDTFSSGHFLRNYKGKCEKPHGHNYKVRVTLRGETLDHAGLLLDFKDLTAREVMVPLPNGASVPLGQVAGVRLVQGPASIRTENAQLAAYMSLIGARRAPLAAEPQGEIIELRSPTS